MTIKRFVQLLFAGALFLAIAAAVIVVRASRNNAALVQSQRLRLQSSRLADELRRTSDDLTRFARAYVVTGEPKFEEYYRDVLAIRRGEKPRPQDYANYWDAILDAPDRHWPTGESIALRDQVQATGLTVAELAKLEEAEALSDALLKTESVAMHAMKGQFLDDAGGFTRLGPPDQAMAIRLVHDAEYLRAKARIMRPLGEFVTMLDARIASAVERFTANTQIYWRLIEAAGLIFVGLLAMSYPLAHRRIFAPVAALQNQTRLVEADVDRLAAVARRIVDGDLTQSFAVAAPPLSLSRRDEVGDLARLHDRMIGHLQQAGAAIAAMTAGLSAAHAAAAAAEQRARDAHAELLAIIDTVPTALMILNPDRSFRLQNKAAFQLLGTPPAEREERLKYFATFTFRDKDGRVLSIEELPPVRAVSGEEVAGTEIEVERPDGVKQVVLIGAAPVRDDEGRLIAAVAGFQDISKLRELDRMKDEFVAIVSHELRTPLTAIRGSFQLLIADDAAPDPDHRELLNVGLRSCERLVRIVNDMLDISKIEAGRLELRLEPVDVRALVGRAVEGVAAVARGAGVSLVQEVDATLPAVRGDADRLTQALVNLLSNAIKFAPRGSAVIVSAHAASHGLTLSVADRGPGIAAADVPKLFQKFQQLADPATRRTGGTGLGLSITKAIVEQHGGAISVDSVVGQGTTFTFSIPVMARS